VLDLQPLDGSDPVENFATVEAELREHGHGLADLPRILALSKADLVPPEQVREAVEFWTRRAGVEVIATSAATGEGLDELVGAIFQHVPPERPDEPPAETPATHRVYRPGRGDAFSVERTGPGAFRVEGERVERLIARHDVDNEEALRYVEERLRALGVIKALESAGFEPGDDVEVRGIIFELDPG
jgi:GTPase